MRSYKICIIIIAVCLSLSCEEMMGEMQDFKHNLYPSIVTFICDPANATNLDPNTPVILTVEASDPEGKPMKFTYSSEDGSFADQQDSGSTSAITFYSASYLTTTQTVKASVKVTDDHEFSVSQDITIGQTREGPSITSIGEIPEYISSDSAVDYSFSVNESGIYQFQVLSSGTTSALFSSSYASYFYGTGETETAAIYGMNSATGSIKMTSNTANNIALVFQDSMGHETYKIFTLTVDDTDPVTAVDTADGSSFYAPATVNLSAADTGSGVAAVSYTINGASPDFSGTGTVVQGSNAAVTIGSSGLGTYTLKYRARDKVGNIEAVKIVTYTLLSVGAPPPVTNLIATKISSSSMTITWTPGTNYNTAYIDWVTGNYSTNAATYTIGGLTANTQYVVAVYAVSSTGLQSIASSITITTTSTATTMDVFYITSLANLVTLQSTPAYWSYYCILTADIAITAPSSNPIGNTTTYFTGYFAGNGHIISGLAISGSSSAYQGFFGCIYGGTVRDLNLTNISVTGANTTGGLAGYNSGTITGCTVSGTVSGAAYIGGLVGWNASDSVVAANIYSCTSSVTVNASGDYAGGLVGFNDPRVGDEFGKEAIINNCIASGTVNAPGSRYVGGLVGENIADSAQYSGTAKVINSHATGNVAGYALAAALVGNNYGTIDNCHAEGNVTTTYTGVDYPSAGGIASRNWSYGTITNCYYDNSSGIISSVANRAGGLVGYNMGSVINCHVISNTIVGVNYVGGLIGYNEGIVANSYVVCNEITGSEGIGGLIGYNQGTIADPKSVKRCYASGTLVSGINYAGGFVGHNTSGAANIECCYSTFNVEGGSGMYFGGFAGYNSGNIYYSYARGAVNGSSGQYTGGFAGYNSNSIMHCYETGLVTGTNYAYGLVGIDTNQGAIVYVSFFNNTNASNGVGEGTSLSAMQKQVTFVSWDFVNDLNGSNDYWSIDTDTINGLLNDGYPYLTATPPAN